MIKANALTFEQVLPHMHKWAAYFRNRRFDHWELINSAWLHGRVRFLPQSKIKFASMRIKGDMIDYMRKETKHRKRKLKQKNGQPFAKIRNFTSIFGDEEDVAGLFSHALSTKNNQFNIEQKDFVEFVTNTFFMTREEKLIVKLYYLEGFTQEMVAKVCGLHATRISQIMTNLTRRLRTVDYSKAI